MTEEEAKAWLSANVSRETYERLTKFVELVVEASAAQNLISSASSKLIWSRHLVDSVQLGRLTQDGPLADIGSGAGFPGIPMAMVRLGDILLIEPRRLRAAFLDHATQKLRLGHVTVRQARVEAVTAPPFATIVARAVAPLPKLFEMAEHLADRATRWVLPKGRSAQRELAAARETWHGDFELVNSVSDADAAIIVASDVGRRVPKRGSGR